MVKPPGAKSPNGALTAPPAEAAPTPAASQGGPDKKIVDDVRNICASLVRAVTASKIYPPGHDSISTLREGIFARLSAFLDRHHEYEVEIKRNAFLFEKETIHKEEDPLRSLPYFFYKDGMQKLSFLKGLSREEFSDFLGLVRTVSLLPLDEGDIVDALWQRDFEHIRYVSPDEFVETKLSGEQELSTEFEINQTQLHEGRIDFSPEDAAEIARRSLELAQRGPSKSDQTGELVAPLTEEDAEALEIMIETERHASPQESFPDLMFELLRLEDRPETFAEVLAYLDHTLGELVLKAEFMRVGRVLNRVGELCDLLAVRSPARAEAIKKFFQAIREKPPLDKIRDVVLGRQAIDSQSFFAYLRFLGLVALPLGADLFERNLDPEFRAEALQFFEKMAEKDLRRVLGEMREDRLMFTIAAIGICGRRLDPAAIPFLAKILGWKGKEAKLKSIRTLGKFSDDRVPSILRRVLQNPDEDLRIEALTAMPVGGDKALIDELIRIVSEKHFWAKSDA
jgi:hypothetical protein